MDTVLAPKLDSAKGRYVDIVMSGHLTNSSIPKIDTHILVVEQFQRHDKIEGRTHFGRWFGWFDIPFNIPDTEKGKLHIDSIWFQSQGGRRCGNTIDLTGQSTNVIMDSALNLDIDRKEVTFKDIMD